MTGNSGNAGVDMEFDRPLVRAVFRRREKRFLIHAELPDGRAVIAHTNNTGRMSGCLAPGCAVWLSPADSPHRKLKWTLELVETEADELTGQSAGVMVGVNTARANRLVAEAIGKGRVPGLGGYGDLKAEAVYPTGQSRADFLLTNHPEDPRPRCWLEVKNVTLVAHGHARFPDAPSERGRKHLLELAAAVQDSDRAVLAFCIQREDALSVGPADDIDPGYGRLLREVAGQGVEILGLRCRVGPLGVEISTSIPLNMV
jgi:sugar fermentation stimulation protein A